MLARLEEHRLPKITLDAEMQAPDYGGASLANLPGSVCRWFGLNGWRTRPLDESYSSPFRQEYEQVILLVIDGMGLELFQKIGNESSGEYQPWQELLAESHLLPMTSIVPSTTSAALTAFWTGCAPSQHGITGYEMWLREYNLAANMITHMPVYFDGPAGSLRQTGFDPQTFLTVPTLGPFLTQAGVEPFVLQHNSIARSGLSTMLFNQTRSVPYRGMNDLFATLEELACQDSLKKRYLYAYWGDLDELQHVYGPQDLRVRQEFHSFQRGLCRFIAHLRRGVKKKTLVLVTADHGQKVSTVNERYQVQQRPKLLDCLHLLPTGESRMPYLHIRPGYEEKVREIVEKTWPGDFIVLRTDQAVAAGLFGPAPYHNELASRLGDLILIARNEAYLHWARKENMLRGRHGGLSRSEMLVPLMIFDCQ